MIIGTLGAYYKITKPGIIRGNLLAAVAGFFLASGKTIDFSVLMALVVGTTLVIGSACVVNNIIDRDIDIKMKRTKKRALVTGAITVKNAGIYSVILLILGSAILLTWTNALTCFLGLTAWFFYVVIYSMFTKRTVWGTLVGTVSGSIPPVAGYAAVTGTVDTTSLLLYLSMTSWQMPHFYSIAVYRRDEYKAAKVPVLAVVSGIKKTRTQIIGFIVLYIIANAALYMQDTTGAVFLGTMTLLSLWWLYLALRPIGEQNFVNWGHKVFGASLIILLSWCLLLSLEVVLP